MKLLDSLYHITERTDGGFAIRLDPEHFIYKAHFPGQPITPGVVVVQIAIELLELLLGGTVQLSEIRNVKFLHVIDPGETPGLKYEFHRMEEDGDAVRARVEVTEGEVVYAKISLVCRRR